VIIENSLQNITRNTSYYYRLGALTDIRLKLSCLKLLGEERVTQLVQMVVQILVICCACAIQVILLIHSWIIMHLVGLAAM
jgi:hypothetical protein